MNCTPKDFIGPPHGPSNAIRPPIGCLGNEASLRYLLEADSTTGFLAWQPDDGTILVSAAHQVSLPESHFVRFWACAAYDDSTPAGSILSLDCHDNALTSLDATALPRLQYLDASCNRLTSLDLTGLAELEGLDVDRNQLSLLDVKRLGNLRLLNCAHNRLRILDVAHMDWLEVLDCTDNPLPPIDLTGCTGLRDVRLP